MELNTTNVEQLIEIIKSADGEPEIIRDMILEGDAIDMIAYILNKAPTATTWKDVASVLIMLNQLGKNDLYEELHKAVYGVDIPSTPQGA